MWSITLIRKTAFSKGERKLIADYFRQNNGGILFPYPSLSDQVIVGNAFQYFDLYAWAFNHRETKSFARRYPYDISVVTDDKPFFYKYYKFHLRDLLWPEAVHHTGSVIFWTQFLVLLQSMIFIIIFIFFPLWRFQKEGLFRSADVKIVPFVTYFACLGFGYMLIEIPLMQKFVLLLGSPIHSISVILAGLLFWTGVGSFLFPYIAKHSGGDTRSVISFTSLFVVMLVYAATFTSVVMEGAMAWSFTGRVALTVMLLAPAGLVLGFFFPAGLSLISTKNTSLISWAWGINCGFSVLASMLAIMMAQFVGFNLVLLSAGGVYLVAALAYRKLAAS
jgi:hypothetical protein